MLWGLGGGRVDILISHFSLKSSPIQMTSLGIPLMKIKDGPFFKAGCLEQGFFTPDNPSAVSFVQ